MAAPPYEYRALEQIRHGAVLAYQAGDLIPADNVEANNYQVGVQVEKITPDDAEAPTTPVPADPAPDSPTTTPADPATSDNADTAKPVRRKPSA